MNLLLKDKNISTLYFINLIKLLMFNKNNDFSIIILLNV
jgi:hypothetical protein